MTLPMRRRHALSRELGNPFDWRTRRSDRWFPRVFGLRLRVLCAVALSALSAHPACAATVVLDTGHTKMRPGSISPSGRPEFAYNLALSDRVAADLAGAGLSVIRVAADGHEVALASRTAQTGQADLFVSIHHDSIQQDWIDAGRSGEFSGFSVFVSAKNPFPQASLKCASTVGAALARIGERPSNYHAIPVPGENRPFLDAKRGVHRYDGLAVLRTAKSPAILIEAGVIANPDDQFRLAQHQTVARLGGAIAAAIIACVQPPSW